MAYPSFILAYHHMLQISYHGISSRARDPNYTHVFSLRLQRYWRLRRSKLGYFQLSSGQSRYEYHKTMIVMPQLIL